MGCPYQYYNEEDISYPRLFCKLTKRSCMYVKKCELEHRFVSQDNTNECYYYNMELRKNVPKGSYPIVTKRKSIRGMILYVEIDGRTIQTILPKVDDYKENYIYLEFCEDGSIIPHEKPVEKKPSKSEHKEDVLVAETEDEEVAKPKKRKRNYGRKDNN
jgi:hypothetical protein